MKIRFLDVVIGVALVLLAFFAALICVQKNHDLAPTDPASIHPVAADQATQGGIPITSDRHVDDLARFTFTIECRDQNGSLLAPRSITSYSAGEQYGFNAPSVEGYVTDQLWYQGFMSTHDYTMSIVYYQPITDLDTLLALGDKPSLELLQCYHILAVYDPTSGQYLKLFDNAEYSEAEVAAYVQNGWRAYDFDKSYLPLSDVELPSTVYIDQDSYLLAVEDHLYVVHADGEMQHLYIQTPVMYQDLDQLVSVDMTVEDA